MARAQLVVVAFVAGMLLTAPYTADAAINCDTVKADLAPCLPYIRGGPGPSMECCSGVKRLAGDAQNTADKRTACNCIKDVVKGRGIKSDNAASIPSKCHVSIPYPISSTFNCDKIH